MGVYLELFFFSYLSHPNPSPFSPASFSTVPSLAGLAFDSNNLMYVASNGVNAIFTLTSSQVLTQLATNFVNPWYILIDNTGYLVSSNQNTWGYYARISIESVAAVCTNVQPPVGGTLGTCPSTLVTSCSFSCGVQYTLSTSLTTCHNGVLSAQTCVPLPCTGIVAPANGQLGNCSSTLAVGPTCQFVCNSGYVLSGSSTSCNVGPLGPYPTLQSCANAAGAGN